MSLALMIAGYTLLGLLVLAALIYIISRYYEARTDRTFMTHDERGFKRALKGKGVLWDFEESVVKGPTAPKIEYVALDPSNGQRRINHLLDPRTGSVNLRPQYCVPLPFTAMTADAHRIIVEARVQFSLNRDLLKYVYQLEDFGLSLETRIQSAFRAEIGKMNDEVLRASLHAVEEGVIAKLRQQERDGDEIGEAGMALGVNFHTASFTYSESYDEGAGLGPTLAGTLVAQPAGVAGAPGTAVDAARAIMRSHGVLALRPQQLDQLADVFKGREAASTRALLAILELQTRQNIAEALASSGHLVVLTPQELGMLGMAARERIASADLAAIGGANGAAPHP